jgi:hypothetical protein
MARSARPELPDPFPTQRIPPGDLRLDAKNPRLAGLAGGTSPKALISSLYTHGGLDELALSICRNGYFDSEPLFAVKEGGNYVVVEGNRRLATVKLLLDNALRAELKATDFPKLTPATRASVERLPVIVYPNRRALWPFVGFRHVNGPRVWDSWSKAQYIAQVFNDYGASLDEIADRIGDKHQTVQRLYRGLMVLRQARDQAGFDYEQRVKSRLPFSHLYTGLDYAGFQKFLGIDDERSLKPNPVPRKNLGNLKELMVWLFGSKADNVSPVVQSQNPDLKRLDTVLRAPKALSALRAGLGLEVAHQLSKGDEPALKEFLTRARYQLQQGMALMVDGFSGQADIVELIDSIYLLSEKLKEESDAAIRTKPSRGKR